MNIIAYTDGSCSLKYNLAGCGIHFPNEEFKDISEPFTQSPITNQRAELYAIYKAIETVSSNDFETLTIYTDSLYSLKSITQWMTKWENNNWILSTGKPVKNKDILCLINVLMKKYPNKIKFVHVLAHTKNNDIHSIGNRVADKLATNATLSHKKSHIIIQK
jgi:ribonuclease HI